MLLKVSANPDYGQAVIRSTSSRKGQTSITHLMNFTLPPRPQAHHYPSQSRYGRRNPTWGLGSGHHAIDKARFVARLTSSKSNAEDCSRYIHASYRFIVDPRGDYHTQAIDADVHLDWNLVLQILASAQSQTISCPICLSIPVAPRMAKCGHIFCLSCLIRYMHSVDDTKIPLPEKKARWKKCPICWDSIYLPDTKPVRWFGGQEAEAPREGGDVVLRLMMRQAGSTLALPRDGAETLSTNEDIPWYFAAGVTDYARIMKGSEDYMNLNFDREMDELQLQEKEDELIFGEETTWTRKAVRTILEAKEKVKGIGNPPSAPKKPEERKIKRPLIVFHESSSEVPDFYDIQHAAKSARSIGMAFETLLNSNSPSPLTPPTEFLDETSADQVPVKDADRGAQVPSTAVLQQPLHTSKLTMAPVRYSENRPHGDAPYFFYQALLHYYLSPLDIRILKAAFGDFASFPTTILPRVERVSTGHIVDEDLRRRAKYLAHLPHGCEVGFLECNWTDVVDPGILKGFAIEVERRRKKNSEKEMREEKERLRAEKSEDEKRWAAARRKRPSVPQDQFPEAEDFASIVNETILHASSSVDLTAPSSSPRWLSSQNRNRSAFASLASPSTSPHAPRTVWGTAAVIPSSPPQPPVSFEPDAADKDGWLQGWERDLLQEDELVSQMQAISLRGEDSPRVGTAVGTGKKKKAKKITLMTTNARRTA